MANDKKFITKNGLTTQNISFVDDTQAANNVMVWSMLGSDMLSLSGNTGQLFSITDSQTGTIFTVNDISGVPSIEVFDTGKIQLAENFGNVLVGTATDDGTNKVQIKGTVAITGNTTISGNTTVTGSIVANTGITVNNVLRVNPPSGGTEGGEIALGLGTGQTAVNTAIIIDTLGTQFRVFESGTPNRGFFFDLSSVTSGQAKVWHASNDGATSGLDADLLDGLESTAFLRSNANNTYSGALTNFNTSGSELSGYRAVGNNSFSVLSNFFVDPASEQGSVEDVRIVNDLAGAHRWATSITLTNCFGPDRVTPVTSLGSAPFDGTSSFASIYTNVAGDPCVVEVDITNNMLTYGAWVGIVFGYSVFRARNVTIEVFRNGAWQTDRTVTNHPSHIVTAGVLNNGAAGIQKIRYTMSNPIDPNGWIRIHSLFAINYNGGGNAFGGVHYIDKYKDVPHFNTIWPAANNTYSLGTSTLRYANVFSNQYNVGNNEYRLYKATDNIIAINTGNLLVLDNATTRFTFDRTTGNFTATGTVTQNSDARLKENIVPIESALDKVNSLRGVYFNKINSTDKRIGVIAQEVQEVIPEVVIEDDKGIKSVAYGDLVGLLIEAIKEQSKKIETLESVVSSLS